MPPPALTNSPALSASLLRRDLMAALAAGMGILLTLLARYSIRPPAQGSPSPGNSILTSHSIVEEFITASRNSASGETKNVVLSFDKLPPFTNEKPCALLIIGNTTLSSSKRDRNSIEG